MSEAAANKFESIAFQERNSGEETLGFIWLTESHRELQVLLPDAYDCHSHVTSALGWHRAPQSF